MQDNESKQQTSVSAMSERGTIGGVIPNSSSTRSFVNMLSNLSTDDAGNTSSGSIESTSTTSKLAQFTTRFKTEQIV